MASSGPRTQCKRLKAEREATEAAKAAELDRLSHGGARGGSARAGRASGSGSRRDNLSAPAPTGASSAAGRNACGRVGGGSMWGLD